MEIKVKPLIWYVFSDNWVVSMDNCIYNESYYQIRIRNDNTQIKRGNEDWNYFDGSIDEAKEFWYKDFSDKVKQVVDLIEE